MHAMAVAVRRRSRVLGSDFQWDEVIVALLVALGMPVWGIIAFTLNRLDVTAEVPEITAGDAVPIRVKPVVDMDSPLLKLGGKKVTAKLPDMWKPKVEPRPQQIAKQRAHVSTKAEDSTDAIPDPKLEVSDAGTAPPPDAAVAAEVDVEVEAEPDAGKEPEGAGGGSAAGSKDGKEADPLKARAISRYRGSILRFLKRGFACPVGGRPGCVPVASVVISGGGVVSSYSFQGCGDSAMDGPAKASISSKVGLSIPPVPPKYPELIPPNFSVSYVCN